MYRESFLNVNPWPRALSRARRPHVSEEGVTMEYVARVLFGMAVLVGLLLFRRRSRLSTRRPHLSFRPHRAADGSFMCFALSRPPGTPIRTDRT